VGDIFREVDEELARERYEKLWKRYGIYLIALAVLIVAAVAGWKIWENRQASLRQAEGARFAAAATLMQDGKTAEAEAAFRQIAAETGSGYGILARFYDAGLRVKAGQATAAIEIYDAIAADSSVPATMRDLATVLGGLQALGVASIDAKAIESRIQPLTSPGNGFRHIALEIVALAAQRAGDAEKAKSNYKAIVDDPAAPTGVRTRAAQMLNILG
jgi:hypothetical protein